MIYLSVTFLDGTARLLTRDEWARLDMSKVDRSIPWRFVNADEHAERARKECNR